MPTQQFKQSQINTGKIMIVTLITYLYVDWKLEYEGSYFILTKGIFTIIFSFNFAFQHDKSQS